MISATVGSSDEGQNLNGLVLLNYEWVYLALLYLLGYSK